MPELNGIVALVDERIAELDQLLEERRRLVAARLALTDPPAVARTTGIPPAKPGRRHMISNGELEAGVRDMLADGPQTMAALVRGVGFRSDGTKPRNRIRRVLEELRAEHTRDGFILPTSTSTSTNGGFPKLGAGSGKVLPPRELDPEINIEPLLAT